MLRIENVSKSYKKQIAVQNLNVDVHKGEVFVLLGPTGAGKTTTLRMISGLTTPDEGKIFFNNEDITAMPPQARNVAFVFEGLNLFPTYTVYDNIAFALRSPIYSETEDEIKSRIDKVSRDLHIDHLLNRKPDTMSGGEIQRVAIARALVRRPELYLLDEPLSNLDLKLREELRAELKELHQIYQSTIIYATHDYIGAVSIADRIGIFYEGRIHQVGSQAELYKNPLSTVVATLMGNPAMNLLTVFRDGKRFVAQQDPQVYFELPESATNQLNISRQPILLGLWPEDIQISLSPIDGYIKSRLYGQEYRGTDRIISLAVGDETLKKMVGTEFEGRYGDDCWFNYNAEKVFVFDPSTGQSLRTN
jgi:multiple sugar transport system ATP-binding protein